MSERFFILAWIADVEEPTEAELVAADWNHPVSAPLRTPDDVAA